MEVGGLEINQTFLRAIRLKRVGNNLKLDKVAEVALPAGMIDEGRLKKPAEFSHILKNFLKYNRFSTSSWAVSISEKPIYTTFKTFPQMESNDLAEAVEINAPGLLPGKQEENFWGWQEVEGGKEDREVVFSSTSKNILEEYLQSFSQIGIIPVSIEPKSFSIARAFGQTASTLILNLEGEVITGVVINRGCPRFAREFKIANQSKNQFKQLLKEVWKIVNFYLTENNEEEIESLIIDGANANLELAEALKKALKMEVKLSSESVSISGQRIPSLSLFGVGLRSLIPLNQDNNLSLLPVGTKEAAEEKMALLFYGGLTNIIVITACLFLLIFWGTFIFLSHLKTQADNQLLALNQANATSINSQEAEIKQEIDEINPQIKSQVQIENQMTYWSPVLKQLSAILPQGVTLSGISFTGAGAPINIAGQATSKEALTSFREAIASQDFAEAVQMPSSNLDQNQNISFTISLTLTKEALKRK
mgnify:CR=1 FL=1